MGMSTINFWSRAGIAGWFTRKGITHAILEICALVLVTWFQLS